jgi:BRCA1/BRCA2-containing complex subunit 3
VSIILERLDKRADRVEISPEQLSMAAEYAEKLSNDLKMSLNICGWYHSHPHITVFPSNVDIKTQLLYQTMDKNFIGLIVSVYNQNKKSFVDTVELIGFQSVDDNFIKIPINICENEDSRLIEQNFQTLYKIPEILTQEEINLFKQHSQNNANFLCNLSNLGLYMHSMSQILDCSFIETINTLECRTKTNEILIKEAQKALNDEDLKMDAD